MMEEVDNDESVSQIEYAAPSEPPQNGPNECKRTGEFPQNNDTRYVRRQSGRSCKVSGFLIAISNGTGLEVESSVKD